MTGTMTVRSAAKSSKIKLLLWRKLKEKRELTDIKYREMHQSKQRMYVGVVNWLSNLQIKMAM